MPDNKIKNVEFDVILPNDLEQHISVSNLMDRWSKLVKKGEIIKLRELRLKKINEINAKYK